MAITISHSFMIYDCFTFFNELELLEIRLNVLDGVVDRFVLVEATKTFNDRPKPLVFGENRSRFEKFLHKITHIVVDDYPPYETAWTNENHQRNCMAHGLRDCSENDVILISDLDEIPNPTTIVEYRDKPGIYVFEQLMHYYYINHLCIRRPIWRGTKMLHYRDFLNALDAIDDYGSCCIKSLNQGTTATKIRMFKDAIPIADGGWHFTFLGGLERVREKLRSYAHEEHNFPEYTDLRNIEKRMRTDFTCHRLLGVECDKTYPAFLRENKERYAHLFGPITPPKVAESVRKTAKLMAHVDAFNRLASQLLTCLIPVKKWRKRARTFFAVNLYGTAR